MGIRCFLSYRFGEGTIGMEKGRNRQNILSLYVLSEQITQQRVQKI